MASNDFNLNAWLDDTSTYEDTQQAEDDLWRNVRDYMYETQYYDMEREDFDNIEDTVAAEQETSEVNTHHNIRLERDTAYQQPSSNYLLTGNVFVRQLERNVQQQEYLGTMVQTYHVINSVHNGSLALHDKHILNQMKHDFYSDETLTDFYNLKRSLVANHTDKNDNYYGPSLDFFYNQRNQFTEKDFTNAYEALRTEMFDRDFLSKNQRIQKEQLDYLLKDSTKREIEEHITSINDEIMNGTTGDAMRNLEICGDIYSVNLNDLETLQLQIRLEEYKRRKNLYKQHRSKGFRATRHFLRKFNEVPAFDAMMKLYRYYRDIKQYYKIVKRLIKNTYKIVYNILRITAIPLKFASKGLLKIGKYPLKKFNNFRNMLFSPITNSKKFKKAKSDYEKTLELIRKKKPVLKKKPKGTSLLKKYKRKQKKKLRRKVSRATRRVALWSLNITMRATALMLRAILSLIINIISIVATALGPTILIVLFTATILCITITTILKPNSDSESNKNKSQESEQVVYTNQNPAEQKFVPTVERYRKDVIKALKKYKMDKGYTNLILAQMTQESHGNGKDVMQCEGSLDKSKGECINTPQDSINYGVRYIVGKLKVAKCKSPSDLEAIKLALQEYTYGPGYIQYAKKKDGKWTQKNALDFAKLKSNGRKRTDQSTIIAMGPWAYGDQYYIPHVLQYYKTVDSPTPAGECAKIPLNNRMKYLFPNGIPATSSMMKNYLTTITVEVYRPSKKVEKVSLTVHKRLASEIKSLFIDLKNAKFPIVDVYCYSWRSMASGTGSRSHHSYGSAIDINAGHNAATYTGGTYRPGKDPLALTQREVKIIKNHGFYWGGDWSVRYFDPMHITYANH